VKSRELHERVERTVKQAQAAITSARIARSRVIDRERPSAIVGVPRSPEASRNKVGDRTRQSREPAAGPWFIGIAASAGGLQALTTVLAGLPQTIPASVVVVQHRMPRQTGVLEAILARGTPLSVTTAMEGEPLRPGVVYVAKPDLHLTIQPNRRFAYTDGTRVRGVLSAANPLLESAAPAFGDRAIAVVLTGAGLDATDGVQAVKGRGGIVIVQDPARAAFVGMPSSAIRTGMVDHVLPLEAIAPALVAITQAQCIEKEAEA